MEQPQNPYYLPQELWDAIIHNLLDYDVGPKDLVSCSQCCKKLDNSVQRIWKTHYSYLQLDQASLSDLSLSQLPLSHLLPSQLLLKSNLLRNILKSPHLGSFVQRLNIWQVPNTPSQEAVFASALPLLNNVNSLDIGNFVCLTMESGLEMSLASFDSHRMGLLVKLRLNNIDGVKFSIFKDMVNITHLSLKDVSFRDDIETPPINQCRAKLESLEIDYQLLQRPLFQWIQSAHCTFDLTNLVEHTFCIQKLYPEETDSSELLSFILNKCSNSLKRLCYWSSIHMESIPFPSPTLASIPIVIWQQQLRQASVLIVVQDKDEVEKVKDYFKRELDRLNISHTLIEEAEETY
ncbi:hypothetical protein B0H34DRAFT_675083 [Crassisporium funariophilum]|nr:hypothetical protein B0H34DRAFT_675083 [Crassisporium funariophilum]